MSERGVFAVDRGIWDHPSFARQAFSEREAFIWLVSEASYRARKARVGSVVVELKRGQVAHSYRFMAERWGWSLGKVQRFLRRLETDTMVGTKSDTGALVITICNYDKYQRVSLPADTQADTPPDTAAIRDRYRLEDRKDKKVLSETTSLREAAKPAREAGRQRIAEQDGFAAILSKTISPDRAAAIAGHRKKNRWPLTEQAAELLAKNLQASGDPNGGADLMIERGWRGFQPSWVTVGQPRRPRRQDRSANDQLVEGLLTVMEHLPDD